LSLLALAIFMRLSLTKAAHVAMSSAMRQEIRVRSGRDDKFVGPWTGVHPLDNCQFPCNKFVISTGAQRSGEICGFFSILTRPLKPLLESSRLHPLQPLGYAHLFISKESFFA
jgi:hypothetical protein